MAKLLYAYNEKDVEEILTKALEKILKNKLLSNLDLDLNLIDEKMTQTQAANFLGISVPTLITYRKDEKIPYVKLGKLFFYYKKDLEIYMQGIYNK